MTFPEKIIYNRQFQNVVNRGGGSAINCIKIFNHDKALEVLVGKINYEDQLMCAFLNTFQQGGKYSTQLASHQSELR